MEPLLQLIGPSSAMAAVRDQVRRLLSRQTRADSLPPVLLEGETGTGKGLLARTLHAASRRRDGPFIDVNCAAIPETLLEAELFGFERGAFTDARQAKPGLFQAAHGGTIFLDEITLLPASLQAKLLTVLEDRTVRRLGSTRSEPVNVWILTATNEDLLAATRARRFREDLYHRLAVLTLVLPPLRERGEDVLVLAEHFLARLCADHGLPEKELSGEARAALLAHSWPGNVRELSNVLERAALLAEERVLTPTALQMARARATAPEEPSSLQEAVGDVERTLLLEALNETGWNISRAATRLGLSRNTIRYRIDKYGLERGRGPTTPPTARKPPRPTDTKVAGLPETMPTSPTPPGRAASLIRWELRRAAFLRVALVTADPTWALRSRSPAFALACEKAQIFGGRIEAVTPDTILVAFGTEPIEDAPRRATAAAMAILKATESFRSDGELGLKLGVHVEEVMLATINGKAEIDADGKAHVATALVRMLDAVHDDGVFVSDAARPFLERGFHLAPAPTVAPDVYRLVGQERAVFDSERPAPPFVGREHELRLIRDRLNLAAQGRGQILGLAGPPGIGKSRLLVEFLRTVGDVPLRRVETGCLSYAGVIPFFPLVALVRGLCGVEEGMDEATVAGKVSSALEAAGVPLERASDLLHLLGISSGAEELQPDAFKARTAETMRRLVTAAARRETALVLIVEDLHWIDAASDEVLAGLVEALASSHALVIFTYRSEYRPPWIQQSNSTQLALQPLTVEEARSLAHAALREDDVSEAIVEMIVTRADGNPFFLEELSRAVRERGTATVPVPGTVQDVLQARIARLPEPERTILDVAAVIGNDAPAGLLRIVAELPDDVLLRGLMTLQRGEFLHEMPVAVTAGAEPRYMFAHALTREVAYESIPEARRASLHACIVEAIERLHGDRLVEHVDRLGDHALRGELWDKAVTYLRQAGSRASLRAATVEAATRFEQALQCLEHLPETRANQERAIELRFNLRNPLWVLAEFSRTLEVLGEIVRMAETLEEPERVARACAYMANTYFMRGEIDRGLEVGARARAIASQLGHPTLLAITCCALGQLAYLRGDYAETIALMDESVANLGKETRPLRGHFVRVYGVVAHRFRSLALASLGRFAEAVATAERCYDTARGMESPFVQALAGSALGSVDVVRGVATRAVDVLEQSMAVCRAADLRAIRPWITAEIGRAYLLSSRVEDAREVLDQALREGTKLGLMAQQSWRLVLFAEACLRAGRRREAVDSAAQAFAMATERGEHGFKAWALRAMGEVAATGGPAELESARRHLEAAQALAHELGMRPLVAHCHAGLARLDQAAADGPAARTHATEARRLYRDMGMDRWLATLDADVPP